MRKEYRVCLVVKGEEQEFIFKGYKKAEKKFDKLFEEKKMNLEPSWCAVNKVLVSDKEGWEDSEELYGFEIDENGDVIEW